MTDVNYNAEIWNPSTGPWTVGARGSSARLYHSTALLLPDASVLVAGGGAPGPQNNTNMEIYYPPYLYDAAAHLRSAPGDRQRTVVPSTSARPSACELARHRGHQPRRADQDRLGHAQLEHGAALHRTDVPAERQPARRCRRRPARPMRRRASTCCSCSTARHAVDRQDRARSASPATPNPAVTPTLAESGQPVRPGRRRREPAAVGHRPERRYR